LCCVILFSASYSHAFSSDDILGIWNNEENDARIEIYRCENKYCGRIVWISKPVYSAAEGKSRVGQPRRDDRNPTPNLRSRPIIGLQILSDLEYKGNGSWDGGKLYDPKSGNTYSGKMTMVSRNKLKLRGYRIFSIFGRSSVWTRADQ
jgi:uncharacterized protein (DUF2147 family)